MNFLFTHTNRYFSHEPIKNVSEKLKELTRKPWYDAAPNLAGRFNSENSFTLTSKWSILSIGWIERSNAYLRGTLSDYNDGTRIEVSVRPNSVFVILFYALIMLFTFEVFGMTVAEGPVWLKLGLYVMFCLILLFCMRLFVESLKIKLEKFLNLSPQI
jgi:hypothetical protein